jgi:predicted regulator of Ras-like GTPase activity (Roadblock/LC7/MglB family)
MKTTVAQVMEALTRIEGVRGAMVVDIEAGVPVVSQLSVGVKETAMAAMSGALFTRTAEAARSAGLGALDVMELEAESGHLVVAGAGPLLVVALADPDARLGMIRVQARQSAKELSR